MVITAKEKEYSNAQSSWREVCIKDVCESIIDCVNKTAPTVDYQTPYKMIRTSNVRDGQIDLSDVKYVTEEIFEIWTRRMAPKKGDIILTREAPLGEVGMIRTDEHIFLGQRLMQYRANPCYLDNRFLLYAFQEHTFQEQIKLLGSGATVEHMRVPDAEKLVLRLPSLPEQQAIATALSDVDALITSLDKLIAKKRDIKQATMQQLLTGKRRLPGFGEGPKQAYKQTEVGVIPEDWEAKSIGDLVTFSGGSQPSRSTFRFQKKDGYIRLIQIRDYKTDEFETYIPEGLARKKCIASDIMIGRYGPPIFQILRGIEGAYNVALIKAIPSSQIDREYLYQFLNQESLFHYVDSLSQRSSGQTGIEMPALKNYPLPLPSLPEQQAIAAVLSDMDAEIAALEQKRDKTRALKQGMMQELLTGKIRLVAL